MCKSGWFMCKGSVGGQSLRSGVTLYLPLVSTASAAASVAPDAAKTFASHIKTIWAKSQIFGTRIHMCWEMYWMTFPWPWPNVTSVASISKIAFQHDKVRTTHPITTIRGGCIALVICITWLDFGEVLLETVVLPSVHTKIRMCFFKAKHYFGHISGMVGPGEVKRKGSACDFDFWLHSLPWMFQGQISK